ncbi:helix-turn-helix domain-containing protein [Actinomadura logoneensis]|uniref:Helix-turn-helix domain-containing protein n=2 Tax=Actinomadura logoneensis TaxID=2293572 RepID=A0A372JNK5_9ACTN|nr:helix-turn-helix domain-containing protein [Actinomadura logoneensis]
MTPSEVARVFRVEPKTVSRWAAAGRLKSVRTPGGQHRFRESDVLALMAPGLVPGLVPGLLSSHNEGSPEDRARQAAAIDILDDLLNAGDLLVGAASETGGDR